MISHACTYCSRPLGAFKVGDGFEDIGAGTRVKIEVQMYRVWSECLECGAASRVLQASMVTAGKRIQEALAEWLRLHGPVTDVEVLVDVEGCEVAA